MRWSLAASATLAILAFTMPVSAEYEPNNYDPETLECPFGYNPSALVNVCYDLDSTGGTPPSERNTGMVELAGSICVIGNTCVPGAQYNPEGGIPYTVPGVPGVPSKVECIYAEVASVVEFCQPVPFTHVSPCNDWPSLYCSYLRDNEDDTYTRCFVVGGTLDFCSDLQ